MPLRKAITIILTVAVVLTVILYMNRASENNETTQAPESGQGQGFAQQVGKKAPGFELIGLDGKTYTLENLQKPVVLNFWASWCGPCRIEGPELVRLYEEYKDDLEIYAVNLTENDSVEKAKDFSEEMGFTFPVLLDEKGQASKLYQIQAVPTSFFISKDGVITDQIIGFGKPEELAKRFEKLVKEAK